jgi:hypothetical protein
LRFEVLLSVAVPIRLFHTYTWLSEASTSSSTASPGVWIMNMSLTMVAVAAALAALPGASFAQASNGDQISRAQVKQELADLVSVGYQANSARYNTYPNDILAAQTRLAAKRAVQGDRAAPVQ